MRGLLRPALLVCTLTLALFPSYPVNGQIRLDRTRQLFLDDYIIEELSNIQRVIQPAKKHCDNPVLRATEPYEGPVSILYGSVLRDSGKYRTWYLTYPKDNTKSVGYAESTDGVTWTKPQFDFYTVEGQRTNLLIRGGTDDSSPNFLPAFCELFGVCKDTTDADASRRYKMGFLSLQRDYRGPREDPFHRGQRRGFGVAGSPDGIHWTPINSWATEAICDGATHWMFDEGISKFVLYGRTKHAPPDVVEAWKKNEWVRRYFWGRSVARVESKDLIHWNIVDPGAAPVVMCPDVRDPPGTEIYSMSVFPYESVFIALVQVFHNQPDTCYLDVQLAVSRDSTHFERVGDRSAFIATGGVGEWDRFNLSLANNAPIEMDDNLRFYYGGRSYRHSPYQGEDRGDRFGGIGLATIKRDRFVSLQASFDGGTVLTKPLMLTGNNLYVNAKSDFGSITVEAIAGDGRSLATSNPIRADELQIPVSWTTGELPDEAVQLKFRLQNAQLFAVWCE